ncbi:MAG: IS66 family insertion sequence element accessory protein TnpA [Mycobacteriales bacterium]
MANTTLWKNRVAAWRASGLSSTDFCAGKGFTAGGLRHWAYRLRKKEAGPTKPRVEPVRLVRVVRASAPSARNQPESTEPPTVTARESSLMLEVEGGRIGVAPGFDPATLCAVLDVLARRARPGRRAP